MQRADNRGPAVFRAARAAVLAAAIVPLALAAQAPRVQVTPNEPERRVDVTIDGKPFTSYIWPTTIKKPVLFPILTAKGTAVTRGFPLEPKKGERVDHPHHVGLWFNFGDVNGLDFWNNSEAIPKDQAAKFGTIVHRRIVEANGGGTEGTLAVEAEWLGPDGKALLREETRFTFGGGDDSRTIDRVTTLTALGQKVLFRDNKEGTLGLRVTRALEQPADKPEVFTDASGKSTGVPVLDNTGVTGQYLSSEGKKGDAVWGTRGKWTLLGGTIDKEPVTIAILDHPANPGHPTYWHARGYGLFAANNLGQKALSNGKDELNLTLEPGKSATFRYRILVLSAPPAADRVEREYRAYAGS